MNEPLKITVTWDDDNSVHEGYRIYKSEEYFEANNLPEPVAVVGYKVVEYNDFNVELGKSYWYRVGVFTPRHEKISSAVLISIDETEEQGE